MKQTRLILVGGFLGAGKTTLIWNVALQPMAQGKRVGLITNDQAPQLVDSRLLKSADLNVQEEEIEQQHYEDIHRYVYSLSKAELREKLYYALLELEDTRDIYW